MRFCVVGAGAMGCLYGGRLAQAGHDVTLVDVWTEHVDAIDRSGLLLSGIGGDSRIPVHASKDAAGVAPADVVIVLSDANSTAEAGRTAARLLAADGFVLTLQNGIGNYETLAPIIGEERTLAGLSYHSAAIDGPGHAIHTNVGPTWIGERDGKPSERIAKLEVAFAAAGLNPVVVDDIVGYIWDKWVLNCTANSVCAITGLRNGEARRIPPVAEYQERIIDEALAVRAAKGIEGHDPNLKATITGFLEKKYNKPSMLLHIEAGKRTEIDALNGAVVREGKKLGVSTPFNEAITMLIKGLEKARMQAAHGPAIDYKKLEEEAAAQG